MEQIIAYAKKLEKDIKEGRASCAMGKIIRVKTDKFAIALDNGLCSCSWPYLEDETGGTMIFDTREKAAEYGIDHDLNFEVIEL